MKLQHCVSLALSTYFLFSSGFCQAMNVCQVNGKTVKTSLSCHDYIKHFGNPSEVIKSEPNPQLIITTQSPPNKTDNQWLQDWEQRQREKRQRAKERGDKSREKLEMEGKLQRLAVHKKVAVGMTHQQVRWAWGKPSRIRHRNGVEIWYYRRYKGGQYQGSDLVFFENEKVSGFDYETIE